MLEHISVTTNTQFNALIRMLEMRLERQRAALKETEEQLTAALLAKTPSGQADFVSGTPANPKGK